MSCTGYSIHKHVYDVYGLSLSVVADSNPVVQVIDSVLAPFSVASTVRQARLSAKPRAHRPEQSRGREPAKTYEVVITRGEISKKIACPEGMRQFWSGTLRDGARMVNWTGEGVRQLDISGLASTFIDIPSRRAKITILEGKEWYLAEVLLLSVLSEFLRAVGHHVVHAASLVYNKNGKNNGILIAGKGGRGKTTTALALMVRQTHHPERSRGSGAAGPCVSRRKSGQRGMKLLADDMTFVTMVRQAHHSKRSRGNDPADGLVIWGLQKACKVHHKTLEMLKWLQNLPRRPALGPDEVLIDVSDLPSPKRFVQAGRFGCTRPIKVEPKVIIFLDDRNMKEHRINPLDKVDAIKILAAENVRAFDSNAGGVIGETFRMLGSLVGRCDCYLLSAGPDVAGLYDVFTGLLR